MEFHVTASLLGVSSNSLRAASICPAREREAMVRLARYTSTSRVEKRLTE